MYARRVILVTSLAVFLSMPVAQVTALSCVPSSAIPAGLEAEQILPDAELTQTPDVVINGTVPEEFSWEHSALPQDGIVTLNWTHTAGTMIHMRTPPPGEMPDSLDFIYFRQSFDWTEDRMPRDAQMKMIGSITYTGSFNASEGGLMFRVYVWLIDSSGNWRMVYKSYPPYSTTSQERRIDLSYFDILLAWGGMIADEHTGVQEDPDDTLTVAVGLSPMVSFLNYSGAEPYMSWNGSVLASFSRLRLDVLFDDGEPPSNQMDPLFNVTYGSDVREVFPDAPEEYAHGADYCRELATDDEGMIYALVGSRSSYAYSIETGHYFSWETILKYDPHLNLVWRVSNTNGTRPEDIEVRGDYIYTSGEIFSTAGDGVYVTKWTLDGQKVWDVVWYSVQIVEAIPIGVAANGSVYVCVYREPPAYTYLLKLDADGVLQWNRTAYPYTLGATDMELVDGNILLFGGGGGLEWVQLLDTSFVTHPLVEYPSYADVYAVDDAGNIYMCYGDIEPTESIWDLVTGLGLHFVKMNQSADKLWNYTFSIIYSGIWYERLVAIALTPLDNGSLIAVFGGYGSGEYHMMMISPDGAYLWHRFIARYVHEAGIHSWYLPPSEGGMSLCVTDSGLVYLGAPVVTEIGGSDSRVLAFAVGPTTSTTTAPTTTSTTTASTATSTTGQTTPTDNIMAMMVVVAGAGVVVIVAVVLPRMKKKG